MNVTKINHVIIVTKVSHIVNHVRKKIKKNSITFKLVMIHQCNFVKLR
jgi:hypothetical protein